MLEQIDKILKSNWSSSWFQKSSSQISPKFKNAQPTNNLHSMSDQVLKILLNNSIYSSSGNNNNKNSNAADSEPSLNLNYVSLKTSPSSSSSNSIEVNMGAVNRNEHDKLHNMLVTKSGMPEPLFDKFVHSNVTVESDELKLFLIEQLVDFSNPLSASRDKRVVLMNRLFCDRNRFVKIVHIRSSENGKLQYEC
jgi:hypothetical protein